MLLPAVITIDYLDEHQSRKTVTITLISSQNSFSIHFPKDALSDKEQALLGFVVEATLENGGIKIYHPRVETGEENTYITFSHRHNYPQGARMAQNASGILNELKEEAGRSQQPLHEILDQRMQALTEFNLEPVSDESAVNSDIHIKPLEVWAASLPPRQDEEEADGLPQRRSVRPASLQRAAAAVLKRQNNHLKLNLGENVMQAIAAEIVTRICKTCLELGVLPEQEGIQDNMADAANRALKQFFPSSDMMPVASHKAEKIRRAIAWELAYRIYDEFAGKHISNPPSLTP